MKLTTFTDFSLRVLMYLAADADRRATIAEIARAFDVSENHLVKVVHFLGKQGWLTNVRGKGGGMELALAPERIRIGQVVRQTEGEALVAECFAPDGGACVIGNCCRLRGVLAEATTAFYGVLDQYTLADMTTNRNELVRVLMPQAVARPATRRAA